MSFSLENKETNNGSAPEPLFSSNTALQWALGLLVAALLLEIILARSWTDPLHDPGTWVLFGVLIGWGLRILDRRRAALAAPGEQALRWASILVWTATLIGGLLGWIL